MKHVKSISLLLLASAIAATLPLAAGVIKKVSSGNTFDMSKRELTGASPRKHETPPVQAPESSGVRLRGLVINGRSSYIGEITFDDSGVKVANIHSDHSFDEATSAVYADGKFYTQYLYQPYIGDNNTYQTIYDANTWDILEERENLYPSSSGMCMTYDPIDCAAYGYFVNDYNDATWLGFGRMNLATGETYLYNSVDVDDAFVCIAASPDGFLYGVNASGQFCRINKSDGVITVLGHTDVKPHYVQSAAIDWNTGTFYWAAMTDTDESVLYTIDPVTYMAKKIGNLPGDQEFIGLYVAEDVQTSITPQAPTAVEANFSGASLSGSVSFDVPESTVGGNALTGSVKAHAAVDGKSFEIDATPGSRCTIPVEVSVNDLYIVSIWVSDDKAQGEKATVQKWIGPDYPESVSNVVCINDNGHVTVTWDAPSSVGRHGGFVDTSKVTYVVGRDGGGSMTTVKDLTECKFEQDFAPDVAARVTYSVRPVYEELVGPIAYSNTISVGSSVRTVPFSSNATNSDDRIIIDANGDGTTWQNSWGYAECVTPSGGADDWLLTPAIALKGGQIYELAYEVSAQLGAIKPQIIEVKMGTGATAADMTFDIDRQTVTVVQITRLEELTVTFTAPADGNYRLGFRNCSENSGTLGLSGIKLKALGAASGPIAPSGCKVEAAPQGQLKATIKFTAPSKDSDGNTIDALSRIEVYRGSKVVGTVENPTPGAEYSVTDNAAIQGENSYEIGAFSADGTAGPRAKVKGWVGLDIPGVPYDVAIEEKDGDIIISWKLPEKGIHGGYVVPEEVIYNIFEPQSHISMASVQGTDKVSLHIGELDGQSIIQLCVGTSNAAGINPEAAITPVIVAGPSYQLPIYETFPNGKVRYSWSLVGDVEDEACGWSPVGDKGPDGEAGVSTYYGEYYSDEQALRSRRISLKDTNSPKLRFQLFGRIGEWSDGGTFRVQICESFDGRYTTVYEKEFTEDENVWTPVEVDLSSYAGKEIFIQFVAAPEYGTFLIGLDDISIRSALDYDASFEGISLDKNLVEVGLTSAMVSARIQNHGLLDLAAGTYNVNFYAKDRLFATLPGLAMPAAFGQTVYKTEYTPDIDDEDPSSIWAEIVSDIDTNNANNRSGSVEINIDKPYCPAVCDLKATEEGDDVVLQWSQPDQSGLPVREVVDDFEAYRNFSVDNAGEWTIIDEDKSPGVRVSYFFPGSNGPMGWVVLEPEAIPRIDGGTHADKFPPYSGSKYIVAYNPSSGDNKDWLITPELSGRAQEISFMARAESAKAGREMFEVYYSTTGTEIADMIRLTDADLRTTLSGWEEYKFNVPQGAKYFAVRCVSHGRIAMHIDDFKYESAATPLKVSFVGYNVYRDGVRINNEVLTTPSFRDTPGVDKKNATYTVRVVYNRGESSHSNPVSILSGVESIYELTEIDPTKQPVYDLSGRRVQSLLDGEIYVTKNRRFIYRR